MLAYISQAAVTHTLSTPDTVSVSFSTIDCGSCSYTMSPASVGLTLSGDTLTLESTLLSEAHAPETITITATLDDYTSITSSVTFTVEL